MKFLNTLEQEVQNRVDQCDLSLNNPTRLQTLIDTGLMDSAKDESFDRLAELAAKLLNAPLTIVSLINEKKQFFKASFGMPSPFDVSREIPIEGSVCRYTLKGEPIIVSDASADPLLKYHPSTEPWGIGAIMAFPLTLQDGTVLGAFSVVKPHKHEWTPAEIHTLKVLTTSVVEEINHKKVVSAYEAEKEMRERFVSSLTHDLRTPLTAAKLNAQIILRNGELSQAVMQKAKQVISSIDRANDMVKDLLDVNLIKANQPIELIFEKVDLAVVVKTALRELTSIFGDRFEFNENTEVIGFWNSGSVQRIIENLCSNAVKYGSKNEPIKIEITKTDKAALLSVHNFGDFIPMSEQAALFEQFKRSRSALESKELGWGLGLTLVKGLTEAHHGTVGVKSNEVEGTTFTVSLPWDSRI